ncbi:MAG: exodeoxyribonuclease VII large subunit [Actinomycetota bacterium]
MPPRTPKQREMIDGRPVYSITEFGQSVNVALDDVFPNGLWIEGEVRGLRPVHHSSGHYFSLVDKERFGEVSVDMKLFTRDDVLEKVMSKMARHGVPLQNGMRVRFLCRPDFWRKSGQLGLIIDDVDTSFALGEIARKREELIKKLTAAGVHEKNKRRPVPMVPLRIGVVSSLRAAGFIDAKRQLEESGWGFELLVADVNVQGDRAPRQIVTALALLDRRDDLDVIIVIRGGGSQGDLAAFDDESVAMAISRCTHPVFTGIGHEIDTSVADIVAHTNLKTPTAVAVHLIDLVERFDKRLASRARILSDRTSSAVLRSRSRLGRCAERLRTRPATIIAASRHRLDVQRATVRLLDPATTLARGWSITRDADGRVVKSVNDAPKGATLVTTVADGTITSTVEEVT